MKVLALGGCGGIGRHAVRTMVKNRWCDHIVIADKNRDHARKFSEEAGEMTSWLSVDVTDAGSLARAMKGANVVMNTTGPYHRFGKSILNAAIKAGCNYIDVCDDWEPTIQMFELNDAARDAGVTAIVGMGATPGISNMLAVKAMDALDEVTELYTCWDITHAKPEPGMEKPSAATLHGIHQLTGLIRVFYDGEFREEKPLKRMVLDYPGIGSYALYTIGHPEAITFPRYRKNLRVSLNLFSAPRHIIWGIKIISAMVNIGVITVNRAASIAESLEPPDKNDSPRRDYQTMEKLVKSKKILPPLFALARGIKDDRPAAAACAIMSAPEGGMGGATGVPLAIGARFLSNNYRGRYGVFSPEAVVDPDEFFKALAPLCQPAKTGLEDVLLTTRSWES